MIELIQNSILNLVTGAGTVGDGQSSYQIRGAYCNNSWWQGELSQNPTISLILSKYVDSWSVKQFCVEDRKSRENERLTNDLRAILEAVRDADYHSLIYGGAALVWEKDEFIAIGSNEIRPTDRLQQEYVYSGGLIDGSRTFKRDQLVILNGRQRLPRVLRDYNQGWSGSFVDYIEQAVTQYEAALYEILDSLRKSNLLGMGLKDFGALACNPEAQSAMMVFFRDVIETINKSNLFPYDKDGQSVGMLSRNLSGLPEIYNRAVDNLVSKSGISYNGLMGMRAKSGLGGNDSELESDYKTIDDHVERRILSTAIACAKLIKLLPNGSTIEYEPLYSDDEKKVAEVEQINVLSNKTRVETVLLLAEKLEMDEAEIRKLCGLINEKSEEPEGLQNLVINSKQSRSQLVKNTANWLKGDEVYQLLMETKIN